MYKILLYRQDFEGDENYATELSRTIYNDTLNDNTRTVLEGDGVDSVTEIPTFKFSILPNHPLYDKITKFKSLITVYCGSRIAFYGRVVSDHIDFYGQKNVGCEGALGFLIDSVQAPTTTDSITPKAFLTQLIGKHNTEMTPTTNPETFKRFTIGNVTATKKKGNTEYVVDNSALATKFKLEGYQTTKQAIESLLIDEYKGYLFARYDGSTLYLDWFKNFTRENAQPIKMAVNMLDRTIEENVDEYFTVLYPIGKNKLTISSVNNGSPYLEDPASIAEYGRIIKQKTFESCKTAAALKEKAQNEFEKRGKNLPTSMTVKAVDMHLLGQDVEEVLVGDKLTNLEDRTGALISGFTVVEMEYNIFDPSQDTYTMENQEAIDRRKTDRDNGTLSGRTGRMSGALGGDTRDYVGNYNSYKLNVAEDYELQAANILEHADLIHEHSKKHEIITRILSVQAGDIYNKSVQDREVEEVDWGDEKVHVKTIAGTTSHQNVDGSTTWVQELTGIRVEEVEDPVTHEKSWQPVYMLDSDGNKIPDLVTGEKVYATEAEAVANEVNLPLRSISKQTQDEFYQVVGTTNIKRVLDSPAGSEDAKEFDPTKSYLAGDYVYHTDANGDRTLFCFTQNHEGAWTGYDAEAIKVHTIQTMSGAHIWQEEDHLVNLVGEVVIEQITPAEAAYATPFSESRSYWQGSYVWYPPEGNNRRLYQFTTNHGGQWTGTDVIEIPTRKMKIKNGTGVSIEKDGVEVGFFDTDASGNTQLNAGLMVNSLNSKSTDIVAIAFSSSKKYAVGDYVTYNGKVYRCTTAHEGSWNASHFTEASGKIAKLKADIVDLGDYATVGTLNARLVKADAIFSAEATHDDAYVNDLYGDSITLSGTGLLTCESVITGGLVLGETDMEDAIVSIAEDANPPSGKIGFTYMTAGGTTGAVNFNIADTAKYKADIGIKSIGDWYWSDDDRKYLSQVKPNAGSDAYAELPTITLDSPLGTRSYANVFAYGPEDGGNKYAVSYAKTLYLKTKASAGKCYLVNTNSDPVEGQNGNILAEVAIPTADPGEITGLTLRSDLTLAQAVTYDTTEKEYTVRCEATGNNVSNSPYYSQIFVSGSAAFNHGWNTLVSNCSSSSYVSLGNSNSATGTPTKTTTAVTGYVWVKNASGNFEKRRSFSLSHSIGTVYHKSSSYSGSLSVKIYLGNGYVTKTSSALADSAWNNLK